MNLKILLFVLSAATITSCSTTYRSGQTPDDVYYSPAKPVAESDSQVQEKKAETRTVYHDRQIVMCIHDPRWRNFEDDYDAYYDPYHYGYTCGYYYNPYYYPSPVYISGAVFTNPKNTVPRMTNLGSYNYSNMVVVNQKTGATTLIRSTRAYNNSNSDNNFIRRIIVPSTNTNNTYRSSDNDSRTYSPSSNNSSTNSSSGSSSSGSSGAPVSRPHRGG